MKRSIAFLATVLCVIMLLPMAVNADMIVDAAYGHPTIDGEITEDEWGTPAMIMDEDTCTDQPWGNGISASVKVYFAWSEGGLYLAAQVTDSLIRLPDNPSNVFFDCDAFQMAINPGQLLDANASGVFFSIGMTNSGTVGVMRHNYADANGIGAVAEGEAIKNYVGKGKKTDDGWQFELYLPWDQVHVAGVSGASALVPAAGLEEGIMLCYLDRPLDRHFKTGMGQFVTGDFGSTLVLLEKNENSYGEDDPAIETDPVKAPETDPVTEPVTDPVTEPVTDPVTEPVTEPATDANTDLISKGDTSKNEGIPAWVWIVAAVAVIAIVVVVIVCAKKKKK